MEMNLGALKQSWPRRREMSGGSVPRANERTGLVASKVVADMCFVSRLVGCYCVGAPPVR